MMQKKAVFIDKDGTLIPDIPYNVDPEKITLCTGAAEGLKLLSRHGYACIIVSNQPGIALGKFGEKELDAVKAKIAYLLQQHGIPLSGFYYCPHHPSKSSCACRKPMPGLLLRALEDHHLDTQQCWMIGDILHDVEAGNRAGCKTILIDNGNETEWEKGAYRKPDYIAKDLKTAACLMIYHNSFGIKNKAYDTTATAIRLVRV